MSSSPVDSAFPAPSGRYKHGAIPVAGLTGGIGSGKSRVAATLRALGAVVIDADAVGHEVLEQPEVRRQVVERFGPDVVHSVDGSIDRRALGSVVFADTSSLRDLEAILHPVMRRRFEEIIAREIINGTALLVVLDAAILLEAGWDSLCDLILFVDASRPVRLDRVARSRGWTAGVLRAREAAQWSCEQKRAHAHVRFRNESTLEDLDRSVEGLFGILTGRSSAEHSAPEIAGRFDGHSYGPPGHAIRNSR